MSSSGSFRSWTSEILIRRFLMSSRAHLSPRNLYARVIHFLWALISGHPYPTARSRSQVGPPQSLLVGTVLVRLDRRNQFLRSLHIYIHSVIVDHFVPTQATFSSSAFWIS